MIKYIEGIQCGGIPSENRPISVKGAYIYADATR